MAIPKALQAKLDQFEQEEKAKSSATLESTSDEQAVEPQETEDTLTHDHNEHVETVVQAPESDTSQSTNTQDENFKRMEGRYKAEINRLKEELRLSRETNHHQQSLIDEITALKKMVDSLSKKPTDEQEQEAEKQDFKVELTADELESFGDISPVLTRVVSPLLEEINQLKAKTGSVTEKITSQEESQFIHQVQAAVSNFNDADLNNPDWQAYLKQKIPFTNLTIQQALATAHRNRDIESIKEIFQGYAKERSVQESQSNLVNQTAKAPSKSLADLATPDKTAVNSPSVKKYKYRMSDFMSKMNAMKSGLISKEEFAKFDEDFAKAASAGLVSND